MPDLTDGKVGQGGAATVIGRGAALMTARSMTDIKAVAQRLG